MEIKIPLGASGYKSKRKGKYVFLLPETQYRSTMGFSAIKRMQEWNEERFWDIPGEKGPKVPEFGEISGENRTLNLSQAVKRFLVESCEDLRFEQTEEQWEFENPKFQGKKVLE